MEILDETSRFPNSDRQLLAAAVSRILARFGVCGRELTIVLIGDEAMRRRNLEHRGVDLATDVLSYPLQEPDDSGMPPVPHLGDVFINLDAALRQAGKSGLRDEVMVLAAHGVLHLLGYDHHTEDAWKVFKTAQRLVLEREHNDDGR